MSGNGYVVRGKDFSGAPCAAFVWYDGHDEMDTISSDQHTVFQSFADADRARGMMWVRSCTEVRIFAVAEDGTETPLPTYEEALALCDAWKALAKAREGLRTGPRDDKAAPAFAIQMGEAIKALAALGVAYSETLGDLT